MSGIGGWPTTGPMPLELATRLDRYVAGNDRALAVVRVPTEAEEQKRAHKRQRQQLREQRLSLAAQGRSLMLLQGRRESNQWWKPARWARLEPELAPWLVERLKVFRQLILSGGPGGAAVDRGSWTPTPPRCCPRAWARLTHASRRRRRWPTWDRFKNRRQVGSYAGLTGGVSASGQSSADLSITKAGNRRLRTDLGRAGLAAAALPARLLPGQEVARGAAQPQGPSASAQAGHRRLCPATAH